MSQESNPGMYAGRRGILIGYSLAIGLMTCFAALVIRSAQWFFPQWDARGVLIVCAFASLESILSFWTVLKLPTAQRQLGYYRITEWAVIIILLKIFTELRGGSAHLLRNIQLWGSNFPLNLLSGEFLLNLMIVFVIWEFSALFASDLHLLEIDEAIRFDERVKTTPIRDRVLRRLVSLAIAVLILAGVMLQNEIPGSHPAPSKGMVSLIVLFFALGLALLSLTRYASLQSAWRQADVQVPAQISRRWISYSLIVIVFLVLLATILPTRYGLGLYETLVAVFRLLTGAISYLFAFII